MFKRSYLLIVVSITWIVLFSCAEKKEVKQPIQPKVHHEGMEMAPEVEKKTEEKAIYACPMKCYTSTEPGKCPKCGMEMKKVD